MVSLHHITGAALGGSKIVKKWKSVCFGYSDNVDIWFWWWGMRSSVVWCGDVLY